MSALRKALPQTVRELRLFGCQQSPASSGVRSVSSSALPCTLPIPLEPELTDEHRHRHPARSAFIQSSYPAVKQANPDLPILIREAHGTPARGFVRFGASLSLSLFADSRGGAGTRGAPRGERAAGRGR